MLAISVIYHFKVWTINIHLTVSSAKNKKREGINYWNKIISLLHQTQSQLHLSWTELAKPCWNVFPTRILGNTFRLEYLVKNKITRNIMYKLIREAFTEV